MKKITATVFTLFILLSSFAQKPAQITLKGNGDFSAFSFFEAQGLVINIGADGSLLEYGTPLEPGRMGYTPGKLQAFMGRVEYYPATADSSFKGKIRSLGTCNITYYASYENKLLQGKIKTLGSFNMDYYKEQDNEMLRGKLKSAGSFAIEWYSSYDNEAFKGKLKTAGNTSITYYSSFDDKAIKGRVKNIGSFSYTWYTSFEKKEYQGLLKNGSITQFVNGINFILKYWQ